MAGGRSQSFRQKKTPARVNTRCLIQFYAVDNILSSHVLKTHDLNQVKDDYTHF